MVVELSLLRVVKLLDQKLFNSFPADFQRIVGAGLPVAEHETTTSGSELGAGFTEAVISDIPAKIQAT